MPGQYLAGILLCASASLLWGGLATACQYLFRSGAFGPLELSSLRLLCSGAVFVLGALALRVPGMGEVFRSARSFGQVALSGVLLYCAHQTFFLAVFYSNAGTGAIYLCSVPLLCAAWLAFSEGRRLTATDALCFALSVGGVSLIVTDGDFSSLKFSPFSVLWGVLSAVAAAAYAIYPRMVTRRLGVTPVVSWGMVAGGLASLAFARPWQAEISLALPTALCFGYIVLFGTILAFWCYIKSLTMISPVIVSLVACLEPSSAYFFSAVLLSETLAPVQLAGVVLVLLNVVILALGKNRA